VPLPAEVTFFMQNQAIPTYRHMLKLSLGLGGVLNILCIPAVAEPLQGDIADTTPSEPADLEANGLRLTNIYPLNPAALSHTATVQPQPSSAYESVALSLEAEDNRAPGFSPLPFSEETLGRKTEDGTTSLPNKEESDHTDNLNKAPKKDLGKESKSSKIQPKPEPWSINELASDSYYDLQRLSVSGIQHVDLTWGNADGRHANDWLNDVAQNVSEPVETLDIKQLLDPANNESIEDKDTEDEGTDNENADNEGADNEGADNEGADNGGAEDALREGALTAENSLENGIDIEVDAPDLLSEVLEDQGVVTQVYPLLDDELGTLRLLQLRSRQNEELGILRALRTAQAAPPRPPAPIAFLGARLGFVDVDNVVRNNDRIEEQIYQAGVSAYLVPRLSETTSLYAIAETNIARYNNISAINYNEVQLQVGLRQRLRPRTFAQIGWRNQQLYSPGYREKLFGVNYIDALVSHRNILNSKMWLDSFYQMRLGFADPKEASRFRQTVTLSLNYGITRNLRTGVLYQLDLDDYTQISRYDTYQQVLGIVSYNLTPESRVSVFGGTRFGNSSAARINLDDTFYGAGLNVNVPLF